MDNLISMAFIVVRAVQFLCYLIWSFAKLHTWLLEMPLSELVPFVFNTGYPWIVKLF